MFFPLKKKLGLFPCLSYYKASVNMGVWMSLQVNVFISFRYIPKSGIARSYSSSVFNLLRNLHMLSTVAAPI